MTNRNGIKIIADYIRLELNLTPPITIEKLKNAIEIIGGKCTPYESKIESENEFDTRLKIDKNDTKFEIVYSTKRPKERILFSIAYELGDVLLHNIDENGKINSNKNKELSSAYREWESTQFAAELLMPENEFIKSFNKQNKTNINLEEMAKEFNVAIQAINIRGQVLNLW